MKTTALILLLTLAGCATTNFADTEKTNMDSWVGHTKVELVQTWGPPLKVDSDQQGGEIYTYEKSVTMGQFPGQVYGTNQGIAYTQARPATVTRVRMFYINKEGKIYHWMSQGREGY